jgi:hypothetical protein
MAGVAGVVGSGGQGGAAGAGGGSGGTGPGGTAGHANASGGGGPGGHAIGGNAGMAGVAGAMASGGQGGTAGAGGASASGGAGASGSFQFQPAPLPDVTFNGCDGESIVGASSGHGVVFTMGASDLQPVYPFATGPILRGTSSGNSVGDGGTIFASTSTLTTNDLFGSFSTYYVSMRPSSIYSFFVGAGGIILNGFSKQMLISPTTKDLHAINGFVGMDAWAVGADATIIHWTGQEWQAGTNPAEPGITLHGVSEAAVDDVWAVGDAGHALHWNGTTWTAASTGTTVNLNAVVHGTVSAGFFPVFYAVGDAGTVLKWDGFAWTSVASPTTAPLYAACIGTAGLIIGGQGGAYSTSLLSSAPWTPYPLNLGVPSTTSAIAAVTAADVWAAFSTGTTSQILHFDGAVWTNVAPLKYQSVSHIVASPSGGTVWFYGPGGGERWTGGAFQTQSSLFGTGPAAAAADNEVWLVADNGSGSVVRANGASPGNSPVGPSNVAVVDMTATTPSDVWAISINQLWQWNGAAWALHPISMPTGSVGVFQHVRETSSGVWILTANQLLRWSGTTLTQWSLPDAVTSLPQHVAQTHFIPLRDDAIWLAGPWGAFRWDGSQWVSRSSENILDLAGDATRVWAITSSAILDFAP